MTMNQQLSAQYEADARHYEGIAASARDDQTAAYWRTEADRARAKARTFRGQHG